MKNYGAKKEKNTIVLLKKWTKLLNCTGKLLVTTERLGEPTEEKRKIFDLLW